MSKTKLLTRAQILAPGKNPKSHLEVVTVPQWGGVVHVKRMNGKDYANWETMLHGADFKRDVQPGELRASVVICTACDKNGVLMFKPTDLQDLVLADAVPQNIVFDKASDMNGLSEESVKVLEGNSEQTRDDKP